MSKGYGHSKKNLDVISFGEKSGRNSSWLKYPTRLTKSPTLKATLNDIDKKREVMK